MEWELLKRHHRPISNDVNGFDSSMDSFTIKLVVMHWKLGLVMEKGEEFLSHFVLLLVFYVAPPLKNLVTWPKKLENMMVDWLDVL
ncbi:hypothetical protein ACFX13_001246 [Malus domestica]